jgi:competence protein ComEA
MLILQNKYCSMKQALRDYFSFNRSERNGIFVLLVLVCLLLIWLIYLDSFFQQEANTVVYHTLSTAPQFARPADTATGSRPEAAKSYTYRYFNPNKATAAEWREMGLTERQSQIVMNYRAKGGQFRVPSDLKKVYGLTPAQYDLLAPWVRIEEERTNAKALRPAFSKSDSFASKPRTNRKMKPGEHLELNGADSLSLIHIPGIGPAFAHRILAYRERLGGFHDAGQLLEVFGLEEDKLAGLLDFIQIDSLKITPLKLNTLNAEEFRRHPYIKWNLANLLVNYRKQHGPYRSVSETQALTLLTPVVYSRLRPYLSVD